GHATHGGNNYHEITFGRSVANDFDNFADAGCVAHRCPAKLHDSKWPLHGRRKLRIHKDIYLPPQSSPTARLSAGAAMGWGDPMTEEAGFRSDREYQALCFR